MLPAPILGEESITSYKACSKERINSSACITNADAEQDNVEQRKPLNVLFLSSLLKSMQRDIGVTSENEAAYFVLPWFVKGMGIALFCCCLERSTLCFLWGSQSESRRRRTQVALSTYLSPASSTLQHTCTVIPGLQIVKGFSFLRGYWKELVTNFLPKCLCCKMIIHSNLTIFFQEKASSEPMLSHLFFYNDFYRKGFDIETSSLNNTFIICSILNT